MVRSIKKGSWLINYQIHGEKIIKLINASKNFQVKGWPEDGGAMVGKEG